MLPIFINPYQMLRPGRFRPTKYFRVWLALDDTDKNKFKLMPGKVMNQPSANFNLS